MNFFRKLFGLGPKVKLGEVISQQKATIVDVRTPAEFKSGHVKGAINIPLNSIGNADKKLKGKEPIVLCCASGMRSGQAKKLLAQKGYSQVYNGGSWRKVNALKR